VPVSRSVAYSLVALACLLLLVGGAVFGRAKQAARPCTGVRLRIDNESNNFFVGQQEITALLTRDGAEPLIGRTPAQVDLAELERRLRTNRFVQHAEVYRALTGEVRVRIRQNRPLARIIHPDASLDQYVDEAGNLLPLSTRFTARVLPLTSVPGAPELNAAFFQDSVGRSYLQLMQHLQDDPFWRAQIAQITLLPSGKVVLWPQVGEQLVEFGYADRVEEKLHKLLAFYRHVLPATGWDCYRRVNVEYRNQVVCQ
jgi:cell division protein FtsQ